MTIKGAVLDNRVLTKDEVESLASLPGKDQLLAQLAGLMMNTVTKLVYVLDAPLKGLATVLQRHADALEADAASNESITSREESDADSDVDVEDSPPDETEDKGGQSNKDPDDSVQEVSSDVDEGAAMDPDEDMDIGETGQE